MKVRKFDPLILDECVCRRGSVWLVIYVGDTVIMSPSEVSIAKAKMKLSSHLDTKKMGALHKFLGL